MRIACIALLTIAIATPVCAGEVPAYALDPVHTRVLLRVDHAGFSKAMGTVSGATGTLRFVPSEWSAAHVEVRVPLQRLDFGDAKWNAAVAARSLLDAATYPDAHFISTDIRPTGPDRAQVCGELTLRTTRRPFCLDVRLNAAKRHPLPPFRRTVGFSATGSLKRSDFGIDAWPGVIGDEVELIIEAEATRSRLLDEAAP